VSSELKNRTRSFALEVVCLCADLPRISETRHVIGQLQRCSTSVAANYRAACRAKSKSDFIAKLGIVEEEADESLFWLEFLKSLNQARDLQLDIRTTQELDRLSAEAGELLAITVASKKTARRRCD